MKKYFKKTVFEPIRDENIVNILRHADKHPDEYIRISLLPGKYCLQYKDEPELEIEQAILFLWKLDGHIYRLDFHPEEENKHFAAAIDLNKYMAFSAEAPVNACEGFCEFCDDESVMGIIHTRNATIFITYDGTKDTIGFEYCSEMDGVPSLYNKLLSLFDITKPLPEDSGNDEDIDEKHHE